MTLEVVISGSPVVGETLSASIISSPVSPPASGSAPRFFADFDWRFVVLDRATFETITFLDKLAFNRTLYFELNQSAYATGDLPSDNPEVNIRHTDGDPFVSYNDRFLIGLRREGQGSGARPAYLGPTAPWVPRFAGLITQVQRQAPTEAPVTHYTAFDPLQYWDARPIVNNQGILPGTDGLPKFGQRGNNILIDLLGDSEAAHGPLYVDWGQTAYYGGTIEDTDLIDIVIKGGGQSLAQAVKQLTDTGTLDIILTPIYDIRRPRILCELNIYRRAGSDRNEAIFAWDMPSRSLSNISLLHDGTQMGNVAAVWLPTANVYSGPVSDGASVSFYGQWWLLTQSFNSSLGQNALGNPAAESLLALAQVELQKRGKTTMTLDPTPERSPIIWGEYFLGDNVPVYASRDFGEEVNAGIPTVGGWTQLQRVQAIPITLTDDGVETVEQLLLTYSNPPGVPTPPQIGVTVVAVRTANDARRQPRLALATGFTGPTTPVRRGGIVAFEPAVVKSLVRAPARTVHSTLRRP